MEICISDFSYLMIGCAIFTIHSYDKLHSQDKSKPQQLVPSGPQTLRNSCRRKQHNLGFDPVRKNDETFRNLK